MNQFFSKRRIWFTGKKRLHHIYTFDNYNKWKRNEDAIIPSESVYGVGSVHVCFSAELLLARPRSIDFNHDPTTFCWYYNLYIQYIPVYMFHRDLANLHAVPLLVVPFRIFYNIYYVYYTQLQQQHDIWKRTFT